MDWLYTPLDPPLWITFLSALLMFLVVIAITRLVGLRSFAKFTTYDFAFTVAIGSAVAAVLTSSTTVSRGATAIAGLLLLTAVFSFLQRRFDFLDRFISNQPLLLMDGDRFLEENMATARVSRSQIIAKLREANVLRFDQVRAVVLETTGDISVLHIGENEDCELEQTLLEGVRREA